jgi:1-acyl-sn-glycerol-3-phosphate acyltransferase
VILIAIVRIVFIALHTVFWSVPVLLLAPLDVYAQRSARCIRFWAKGNLFACGVKVDVRGREQLDPRQAYVFMANHQSMFDIVALMVSLEAFQLRWVAKHELRKVPLFGLCMARTHQILVDRQSRTQAVATIRKVKALLQAGISVLFFPEGTRSQDGRLLPFKPGGFAVAVETGSPVVPVTINGGRDILPSGSWKIRSGRMNVVFGQPIARNPSVAKKTARQDLLVQVEKAIAQHHTSSLDRTTATQPASPGHPERASSCAASDRTSV